MEMAKCLNCGKKSLFLKLNARGICEECAEKAKSIIPSNQIVIGFGVNKPDSSTASIGHNIEEKACQYFIDELVRRGKQKDKFSIEHRSQDYTSLIYDEVDFIRIKMTSNVNWISISLSKSDRNDYETSDLFAAQKDKATRHWRSYFDSYDALNEYVDLAYRACIPAKYDYDRKMTDSEIAVANYIRQLFVDCGADPDRFYCLIYSADVSIMYNTRQGDIRFKAYARKPGGYIVADYDYKDLGIKFENDRISFASLGDLDFLKDKIIPYKIDRGLNPTYSEDMGHYTKYPIG
ncbi:MAG: hypothetical protein K6A74_03875 [Lachnospiraceae bacterium]|nr:hypothetical protein [Lachnospiraceae bacterium]